MIFNINTVLDFYALFHIKKLVHSTFDLEFNSKKIIQFSMPKI